MGEARADREPIDRRKGKIMTPRGTSNAFCTGASHFMFNLEKYLLRLRLHSSRMQLRSRRTACPGQN